MYKVDRTAAAAFHLLLHSAGGLHIFDHASRPAADTVAGCSSQWNGSQHCNHVITSCYNRIRACYSEFPVYISRLLYELETLLLNKQHPPCAITPDFASQHCGLPSHYHNLQCNNASSSSFLILHNAICRHHPPQRAVLSQICCFGECKVVLFQILLDGAEPRDAGTTWLSSPVRRRRG